VPIAKPKELKPKNPISDEVLLKIYKQHIEKTKK